MRKFSYVELGGHKVFGLNNAPLFHNGLLDQGYYPDGLLTPPSDEAMVNDIETMKRCGFNMLRKHIKIEPLRWYYHCDRLGMIVWQDMVSGGQPYSFLHVSALPTLGKVDLPDQDAKPYGRSGVLSRARFRREMADTVRLLYNCPCIALWTVFNEGWGQFDALDMANELKKLDPTRFIDHASGWQDQGYEEMKSRHIYFRPVKLKNDGRALALTEYGGYILAVDGHRWTDKVFGYRVCRDSAALAHDYKKLMLGQVLPHIRKEGLTAAVYTQITDVEEELNGLMTYDREVLKIPERRSGRSMPRCGLMHNTALEGSTGMNEIKTEKKNCYLRFSDWMDGALLRPGACPSRPLGCRDNGFLRIHHADQPLLRQ